ncbi:chitosanase [Shewanella cyperi]|uniref:Chitosanase n=1 Tax=Shewanella cyperi TaxID=2814292 RepID=A0A974XNJ6_9GAMM|nr:chitosanase [Shewanella cyperi]QSX31705.1 chitosanase [Shewanella cyperi]QSX42483.1 chitosanase [Shewanella cyperi]
MADPKTLIQLIETQFGKGHQSLGYDSLKIQDDGVNGSFQITYGRCQAKEQDKLRYLIEMYVENEGVFSDDFVPFLDRIGTESLVSHEGFHQLLVQAANDDPIMRQTQDAFFDTFYWDPAKAWCEAHGLMCPLSLLVIYDSFVQSGCVPLFLRKRFSEKPPSKGGDEHKWLAAYVEARHQWLKYHKRRELRAGTAHTQMFRAEMARGNWDLSQTPIMVEGVPIG